MWRRDQQSGARVTMPAATTNSRVRRARGHIWARSAPARVAGHDRCPGSVQLGPQLLIPGEPCGIVGGGRRSTSGGPSDASTNEGATWARPASHRRRAYLSPDCSVRDGSGSLVFAARDDACPMRNPVELVRALGALRGAERRRMHVMRGTKAWAEAWRAESAAQRRVLALAYEIAAPPASPSALATAPRRRSPGRNAGRLER
jgi:hypothetical protein